MLEKLFTSKVRVKILQVLLFGDKAIHLREIARKVNTIPTYVKKELDNLINLGLVLKDKKANLSIYSINKKSPIFNDIKNLFIKTDYLGDYLIKSLKDAKYALIYGSFASGKYENESDIDIMVISDSNEKEFINVIRKLEIELGRELNYILWNIKTFEKRAKSNSFLRTMKQGKIIMLIGDENEFRKKIK